MPPLERPRERKTFDLPPRAAISAAQADVLVVGGGPAGLGAAVGAAQAGAKVILAERYGFPGGNATVGLVTMFTTFYTRARRKVRPGEFTLFPTDHGPGEPVIAGVLETLIDRMVRAGGALPPILQTGHTVPFDPEVFKMAAMDLLDEAGVKFLFHAQASGIIGKDRVEGVVFETKSGPVTITARVIVDCTGDGDVAFWAGAPFQVGRDEDGLTQPMTLYFRVLGFEKQPFSDYVRDHPDQWDGVFGLWDLIEKATKAKELKLPREDILMFATPNEHEISVNSTRVVKVFGTDVWDLTNAEWQSRRQMRQIAAFLKKYVPGFERSFVVQTAVSVCVRETRRILGDYVLTGKDILAARKFDDVIARGTYPLDIHNPKGKGTVLKRLPAKESYDIPLRCLIPKETSNLLVAGRCISGNHGALASFRVMPISMATGQAAGACAALAALKMKAPRDVPAREVQKALKKQNANLRGIA
ncbi:MAG: FAD-dependent oxidoreductase [Endomicrobiales bacterium]